MSDVGGRVYEATGEAFQRRSGPLLAPIIEALCLPLVGPDELTAPTAGGWPAAVDLEETPDPRWLATITGTRLPAGMDDAQVRDYIRTRSSWSRGTPAAMLAAAREAYPAGRITFLERDGSPWKLTIQIYGAEATTADLARVKAAVEVHKPVGIVLDVARVVGATYAHMSAEHGTYDDLAGDFATYDEMTWHVPEEGTTP